MARQVGGIKFIKSYTHTYGYNDIRQIPAVKHQSLNDYNFSSCSRISASARSASAP